jgi:hypothetical protein
MFTLDKIVPVVIGALIAFVLFEMVVKKALKLDSYDEYEAFEEA